MYRSLKRLPFMPDPRHHVHQYEVHPGKPDLVLFVRHNSAVRLLEPGPHDMAPIWVRLTVFVGHEHLRCVFRVTVGGLDVLIPFLVDFHCYSRQPLQYFLRRLFLVGPPIQLNDAFRALVCHLLENNVVSTVVLS